ncbi:MAG TPA: hypothetical protein VKZ50_21135 [bacterium]|nr:hypothetical protein [bacterium]
MLRQKVLGKRIDEFLLDAFIVCFAAGNLVHSLAPVAAATFVVAVVLCIDFSARHAHPFLYDAPKGRRSIPRDYGRPG